jgi:hypothetical protein
MSITRRHDINTNVGMQVVCYRGPPQVYIILELLQPKTQRQATHFLLALRCLGSEIFFHLSKELLSQCTINKLLNVRNLQATLFRPNAKSNDVFVCVRYAVYSFARTASL